MGIKIVLIFTSVIEFRKYFLNNLVLVKFKFFFFKFIELSIIKRVSLK